MEGRDKVFPKHPRIENPKLMKQLKIEVGCCEKCGNPYNLESAHIIAKGMGGGKGPDIRENAVVFCGPAALGAGCHGADHRGEISQEEKFEIAGRREGKSSEECRVITRRAMGYQVE